jgi:hypothetical protein
LEVAAWKITVVVLEIVVLENVDDLPLIPRMHDIRMEAVLTSANFIEGD